MSYVLDSCRDLPVVEFAPGDIILREGGSDKILYVLIEGAVEILKEGLSLNLVTQPGALFGEVAVLLEAPHIATVQAIETTRMHVIEDGTGLLAARPELTLSVARLVASRLQQVTGYLGDLKRQYEDQGNHLEMVSEVLNSLLNEQAPEKPIKPGSDRDYEPNL